LDDSSPIGAGANAGSGRFNVVIPRHAVFASTCGLAALARRRGWLFNSPVNHRSGWVALLRRGTSAHEIAFAIPGVRNTLCFGADAACEQNENHDCCSHVGSSFLRRQGRDSTSLRCGCPSIAALRATHNFLVRFCNLDEQPKNPPGENASRDLERSVAFQMRRYNRAR
jgi:hypothetical protein